MRNQLDPTTTHLSRSRIASKIKQVDKRQRMPKRAMMQHPANSANPLLHMRRVSHTYHFSKSRTKITNNDSNCMRPKVQSSQPIHSKSYHLAAVTTTPQHIGPRYRLVGIIGPIHMHVPAEPYTSCMCLSCIRFDWSCIYVLSFLH